MNNLNVAKIQLNGDPYEINDGTNLNELLNKLKIQKNKVAIEVNGEIVIMIENAKNVFDGIIINAAGYTHTSVAILDALLAIKLPTIEVHITNIYNREEFRKKSLISKAAKGIICGFGINGYIMALDSMKESLSI